MSRRYIRGFTLIELMVTISIMAILLAIAVPSYQSITTDMRMSNEINALLGDINFARSEAVKRGQNISVCPPGLCAAGNANVNWAGGWTVYNLNPAVPVQLHISSGVGGGDTLNGDAPVTVMPSGYVSATSTITLHTSQDDLSQRRCILFATGAMSIVKGATCP
jgi:type IV fimbrial biogenesis protein FimT